MAGMNVASSRGKLIPQKSQGIAALFFKFFQPPFENTAPGVVVISRLFAGKQRLIAPRKYEIHSAIGALNL